MPGATHSHSMVTVPATLIEGLEREVRELRGILRVIADGIGPVGDHAVILRDPIPRMVHAAIASSEAEGGE